MYKGSYSMNARFGDHFRSVLSFVLSMFFDIYCNIFRLRSVPRRLIFIKLISISLNGDKNTTVTCGHIKRALLHSCLGV